MHYGANLVLAASVGPEVDPLQLSLKVLDPDSNSVLRERQVRAAWGELTYCRTPGPRKWRRNY